MTDAQLKVKIEHYTAKTIEAAKEFEKTPIRDGKEAQMKIGNCTKGYDGLFKELQTLRVSKAGHAQSEAALKLALAAKNRHNVACKKT